MVAGLGVGERVQLAIERTGARDRVAVGAGRRVLEQLDEARLDVVGDHVLPPARLGVDLVPLEADDVDQQALGEPVLAHHALGAAPALRGERERASLGAHVAVVAQPAHHLRDRRRRVVEALCQPRLDDLHAFFLELVDGLEVLLDRRVETGRHVSRILVRLA